MSLIVVTAVLAASLLHASRHALVKSTPNRVTALAGMNLVSALVALGLIPFVRLPSPFIFLIIGCSVLLHVSYKIGLAALYMRADLSQAYPLARGLTPILATVLGVVALGQSPDPSALIGIALVSAGLMALTREKVVNRIGPRTLAVGALTGFCVAAYAVLDTYAIRRSGDWLGFTAWLVLCDSVTFVGYTFLTQGRHIVFGSWAEHRTNVVLSGVFGCVSFGVFLWALAQAPVGAVSALRETSVLFAAVLGGVLLKESATWLRYAAATSVMAGIIAIAVFR